MGQPVFMLQDGAVDELMSVVLALKMDDVDLVGIGIANADCLGEPTARTTHKILAWLGEDTVPVGLSSARAVNAFPWEYRQYSLMVDLLPILNRTPPPSPEPGPDAEQLLIDAVHACISNGTKLVVLVLCPLTPLVNALSRDPSIKQGIAAVVWMGGALDPQNDCGPYGNVDTGLAPGANPNAEWNAFWDPVAVAATFASGVRILVFPLNVTNLVMMNRDFILDLGAGSEENPIYDLAGQMYSMVAFQAGYSFWDTATTAFLGNPRLFGLEQVSLGVVTDGPEQGTIFVDPSGTPVNVARTVDVDGFYTYLKTMWAGPV